MKFEEKNVKRAVKDFDFIILALTIATSKGLYISRLRSLIAMIKQDCVLSQIISPYFEQTTHPEKIEQGDWFHGVKLHLPQDTELKIAYVLQIAEKLSNDDRQVKHLITNVYSEQKEIPLSMSTIRNWNEQLLFPTLQTISNRLNDWIEEEVDGQETVTLKTIQFEQ